MSEPDSPDRPTDLDQPTETESGSGAPRRIPIGTQRPGVAAPKLPPRHQYTV